MFDQKSTLIRLMVNYRDQFGQPNHGSMIEAPPEQVDE